MFEKIDKYITGFKIWFWWKFIIKKNEFHPKLSILKFKNTKKCYLKREIAHLLDLGLSPFNDLLITLWKRCNYV